MSRSLRYGDLVRGEDGMYGVLVSQPIEGQAQVLVAFANGTEQLVLLNKLQPCPLCIFDEAGGAHANFREWVSRRREPVDRAVYAFMGEDGPTASADYDMAVQSLFVTFARIIANMDPALFDDFGDMTKKDYIGEIVRLLAPSLVDGTPSGTPGRLDDPNSR